MVDKCMGKATNQSFNQTLEIEGFLDDILYIQKGSFGWNFVLNQCTRTLNEVPWPAPKSSYTADASRFEMRKCRMGGERAE